MSNHKGDVVFYTCGITGRKRQLRYFDTLPHDLRCPHTPAIMRPLFCGTCTEAEVVSRYVRINNAYRAGSPVMDDQDFDRFEMRCRDRYPHNTIFHSVGVIET